MRSSNKWFNFNSVEQLYMLFIILGVHFIHCDGQATTEEWNMLNGYTEDLSNRITNFDFIHEQQAFLKSSSEEEYLENRYPFNQDVYNEYIKELNELESLEDMAEEFQQNEFSSEINFNPWVMGPDYSESSYWESREIKTKFSWNLEKNINAYYDFTGEFKNHLADINDIITVENRRKLENIHLTPQQYRGILNKIKLTSNGILIKIFNENYIDFNSLSVFEKILVFSKSFVDAEYKSYGEQLGVYSFNKIHLDDRMNEAIQITTLIHELSHHLLAEIFEQAAMILFNSDKTDALEWYVDISMHSSNCFVLLNEYCAHSVEGHFIPPEYQNYGSFLKNLEEFDLGNYKDKEIVLKSMILGNTFCQDILTIIEPFIASNLKDDIKQQFNDDFDLKPDYFEIPIVSETFDIDYLLNFINYVFLTGIEESLKDFEE